MYFHEKKIEFKAQRIDVLATVSSHEEVAKVPILRKMDSDESHIGVEKIFEEYVGIDSNEIIFKPLENLMKELAFAVCLAPENISESQLHWPFNDKATRQNFVKYILRSNPEFKTWLEKYCGVHFWNPTNNTHFTVC